MDDAVQLGATGTRWGQRFTPPLIDAARTCRHTVGFRWFVDETYVKVAGVWRFVYRAVDEHDQVIDVLVSRRSFTDPQPALQKDRPSGGLMAA